jgi:hypothetical protein
MNVAEGKQRLQPQSAGLRMHVKHAAKESIEDGVYTILISAGKYPDSRKDKIIQPVVTGLDRANAVALSLTEELHYQERKRGTRYYVLPYPVRRWPTQTHTS